ncbi:hypothetical protein MIMGU_mgv1a017286mg [Erythranthe guttata]|uniref:Uncharacterized protein n=1 Tax=Erythranthe guttata TaxID=4155 RepID=A0A022RSC6_ERYGU|nr:hypothetical protein MIMGU_mgv1a017286mg [Erythranthe guttata]
MTNITLYCVAYGFGARKRASVYIPEEDEDEITLQSLLIQHIRLLLRLVVSVYSQNFLLDIHIYLYTNRKIKQPKPINLKGTSRE